MLFRKKGIRFLTENADIMKKATYGLHISRLFWWYATEGSCYNVSIKSY